MLFDEYSNIWWLYLMKHKNLSYMLIATGIRAHPHFYLRLTLQLEVVGILSGREI